MEFIQREKLITHRMSDLFFALGQKEIYSKEDKFYSILAKFRMLKMMKMINRKKVMNWIHLNHLISKYFERRKNKKIHFDCLEKCSSVDFHGKHHRVKKKKMILSNNVKYFFFYRKS